MSIYLVGYRATGKSTTGKILAGMLDYGFIDTDAQIEARMGRSIASIVEKFGWQGFRQVEKEVLFSTAKETHTVVATGGGIVIDPENRLFLKTSGVCVWLCAAYETIVDRIDADLKSATLRPSLTGSDIKTETEMLFKQRAPYYSETADLVLDTSFDTPERVAEKIKGRIYL